MTGEVFSPTRTLRSAAMLICVFLILTVLEASSQQLGTGLASLPLDAQGPISAALGRDDSGYSLHRNADGFPWGKFAPGAGGGVPTSRGRGAQPQAKANWRAWFLLQPAPATETPALSELVCTRCISYLPVNPLSTPTPVHKS